MVPAPFQLPLFSFKKIFNVSVAGPCVSAAEEMKRCAAFRPAEADTRACAVEVHWRLRSKRKAAPAEYPHRVWRAGTLRGKEIACAAETSQAGGGARAASPWSGHLSGGVFHELSHPELSVEG